MESNLSIVSSDYFNAGGHCMVEITTVYDKQQKKMLYVFNNEEGTTVSNFDFVRNELPNGLEAEDTIQYSIDCSELTWDPRPENQTMNNLPDELVDAVWTCRLNYIRHTVADTGHNYHDWYLALPPVLASLVGEEYAHWLDGEGQCVETDGYNIIVDSRYTAPAEVIDLSLLDENGHTAVRLREGLNRWLPRNTASDEEMQKFYESNVYLIVNDELYVFGCTAAVYQALDAFADDILSEQ